MHSLLGRRDGLRSGLRSGLGCHRGNVGGALVRSYMEAVVIGRNPALAPVASFEATDVDVTSVRAEGGVGSTGWIVGDSDEYCCLFGGL